MRDVRGRAGGSARSKVVFGARDLRFGGVRSKFRLADAEVLNHRLVIEEGVFGAECAELMLQFLCGRRGRRELGGLADRLRKTQVRRMQRNHAALRRSVTRAGSKREGP